MKCRRMIYIMFLTSVIGIFTACSPTAYAVNAETLAVNAAWVDGDLIKISVTDKNGTESTLALRLSDYIDDTAANEYITVQAVDLEGNKSGTIQIKNPHYIESKGKTDEIPDITVEINSSEMTDSGKPLTPDGSGTVMDNVFDDNGKEIFSIVTESEDVFYLIVDRERTSDNVYLLNAVTEDDLLALAQKNGRTVTPPTAVIPTTEAVIPTVPAEQTAAPEPEIKDKMGGFDNKTIIFIIIAIVCVGGFGYYFKVHRGKKQAPVPDDSDDEEIDEYPNNTANDLDEDSGDGDDEDE